MTRRDDVFACAGVTWRRQWTGEAYHWHADGDLVVGWSRIVYDEVEVNGEIRREGRREYFASLAGGLVRDNYRTPRDGMEAAVMARQRAKYQAA